MGVVFMILFRCNTFFQLIAAIQIKLQCLPTEKADLHLIDGNVNFDKIFDNLSKLNVFAKIIVTDDFNKVNIDCRSGNFKFNSNNPLHYIDNQIIKDYSDIYLGLESVNNKLFYYAMVKKKYYPKIHIFDDGLLSYKLDSKGRISSDQIPHSTYPTKRQYINNISEKILYNPNLFLGENYSYSLVKIPNITEQIRMVFNRIFEKVTLPTEKYIYFSSASGIPETQNLILPDELDLMEQIAQYIGKNNIIVKPHPRTTNLEMLKNHDFKIMHDSLVPWEIVALNNDISKKVLIGYTSGTLISPYHCFKIPINSVYLRNIVGFNCYKYGYQNKKWNVFFDKMTEEYNRESRQIYLPQNFREFEQTIKHIDRHINYDL